MGGETIRVEHSKDYTVLSNKAIRDKRLSFRARGLHHLLLSYPDGWQINIEHLTSESEIEGRDAITSALQELEKFGYLTRTQKRVKGKFSGYESVIRELPIENPQPKSKRSQKKPETVQPETAKPETVQPETVQPETAKPEHNKYLFNQVSKKEEVSREEAPYPQNGLVGSQESEIGALEHLEQTRFSNHQKSKPLQHTDPPSLEQKSAAPLANIETTADRVRRIYRETGILPKEPIEFEAWIQEDLGQEIIALYRKSGLIATTKRGDINPSFAKYVADQWKGKDIDYGYNSIRSMERDPQRWEALASLVAKWQAATITGNKHINLSQEFNNQQRTAPPMDFGGRRI